MSDTMNPECACGTFYEDHQEHADGYRFIHNVCDRFCERRHAMPLIDIPQWVKDKSAEMKANEETLRDRFAMAALGCLRVAPIEGNEMKLAATAYLLADAMLEARKR